MKNKALLRLFNEFEGRFELDFKPGIQMRIDADQWGGNISKEEATIMREALRDVSVILHELQSTLEEETEKEYTVRTLLKEAMSK